MLKPRPSIWTGLPRLPSPFQRAVSNTPADRTGACVDCFPARAAFPEQKTGRRLHRLFRGLLELHSRCSPLDRSTAQGGLCHEASARPVTQPNGLMYVLSTGCQWRAIPKDLPPKSTIYDYFDLWTYGGTLERIHHALYEQCREQAQREASPTAAIIDSQSVKSAEKGGPALIRTVTMQAKVRLEGACHLWRKIPFRQLSIDLEADERFGWVTGRAEAA